MSPLVVTLLVGTTLAAIGLLWTRLVSARRLAGRLADALKDEQAHRMQAEHALDAAHERFSEVFRFLPDLVTLSSLEDARLIDMNLNWSATLGYDHEECVGQRGQAFGMWSRAEDENTVLERLRAGRSVHNMPITLRRWDGSVIETLARACLLQIGTRACVLTVFRDISEQLRLERAERAATESQRISEAIFSAAFHCSPDYITISRLADGTLLELNQAFVQLVGWSREEAIGTRSVDLGLWPIPEERATVVDRVNRDGAVRNFPCTIGTRDGSRRHCLLNASSIVIEGQACLIAIVRDVSEQKAADDALQESQAKFSRIFASAPVAMSVTRLADRTHVDANPAWENLFGLQRQAVLTRSTGELGFWVDTEVYDDLYARIAGDEVVDQREVRIRPRGRDEIATCLVSGCRLRIHGEDCGLWSLVDISELRRIQGHIEELNEGLERRVADRTAELQATLATLSQARDELVRREKLAALGSLVAGIAHELNTPIGNSVMVATTLAVRTEAMAQEFASGELRRSSFETYVSDAREAGDLLMRSLLRAQELVRSFKQVAVDQSSEKRRPFELGEMLHEIAVTLGPMLKASHCTLDIAPADTLRMDSYPGALGQILTNLIGNALIHAFPGHAGGRIVVSTQAQADSVSIRIADNGIGIDESSLQRIFDPFFTTRLGTGGSGLGLYIVYNLVTCTLGGQIQVGSTPGSGTCFTLTLPCIAPADARQDNAMAIPTAQRPWLNFEDAGPII
jgi:PAS domain S-box-containing protein